MDLQKWRLAKVRPGAWSAYEGRCRAWFAAGVLLLGTAFKGGTWSAHSEELTGSTEVTPGVPVTLLFRSTLEVVDREATTLDIDLAPVVLTPVLDRDETDHVAVTVTGRVVGDDHWTCQNGTSRTWDEADTGLPRRECGVNINCSEEALCEATFEFQFSLAGEHAVVVEWVASSDARGNLGCSGDAADVEASVLLEQLH